MLEPLQFVWLAGAPLINLSQRDQAVRKLGNGVAQVVIETAVKPVVLDDGAINAGEVHLGDHLLRGGRQVGVGGRAMLKVIVLAFVRYQHPPVPADAEVEFR